MNLGKSTYFRTNTGPKLFFESVTRSERRNNNPHCAYDYSNYCWYLSNPVKDFGFNFSYYVFDNILRAINEGSQFLVLYCIVENCHNLNFHKLTNQVFSLLYQDQNSNSSYQQSPFWFFFFLYQKNIHLPQSTDQLQMMRSYANVVLNLEINWSIYFHTHLSISKRLRSLKNLLINTGRVNVGPYVYSKSMLHLSNNIVLVTQRTRSTYYLLLIKKANMYNWS